MVSGSLASSGLLVTRLCDSGRPGARWRSVICYDSGAAGPQGGFSHDGHGRHFDMLELGEGPDPQQGASS